MQRKNKLLVVLLLLPLLMGVVLVDVVFATDNDESATSTVATPVVSCTTKLQQLIEANTKKPYVTASMWLPSTIDVDSMEMIDIKSPMAINTTASYCKHNNDIDEPIVEYDSVVIGQMPQMNEQQALQVLQTANTAWDKGTGIWTTQYTTVQRIEAVYKVLNELQTSSKREEIIQVLQWEIGKNYIDAAAEFDRTIQFAKQIMNHIVTHPEFMGGKHQFTDYQPQEVGGGGGVAGGTPASSSMALTSTSSYTAYTKRTPIGIILMLAPYNYPINECYATLIPALLLGNICIVKIPSVGGLAHLLTIEAFAKWLPHGAINFIAGSGAKVLPTILQTGDIHGLAMIGSSKSADQLIRYHTQPHRLKTFLQLGAKNVGIVLPDVFHGVTEQKGTTIFKNMITESILGSLSFNGQRCTALKIFFVPKQHADLFVRKFSKAVESLNVGLPWQNHTSTKKKAVCTPR